MAGWNHELFGCLGNPSLSLLACLMMPLAVGKNAEFAGESSAVLWVIAVQIMPCLGGALLRGLIRKKQNIEGSFIYDFAAWLCCPCCALCQDTRETGSLNYLCDKAPASQKVEREAPAAQSTETPAAE